MSDSRKTAENPRSNKNSSVNNQANDPELTIKNKLVKNSFFRIWGTVVLKSDNPDECTCHLETKAQFTILVTKTKSIKQAEDEAIDKIAQLKEKYPASTLYMDFVEVKNVGIHPGFVDTELPEDGKVGDHKKPDRNNPISSGTASLLEDPEFKKAMRRALNEELLNGIFIGLGIAAVTLTVIIVVNKNNN